MSLFEGAKASLLIVPSSPSLDSGEGEAEGPGFCIVDVVDVVEANSSMPRRTTEGTY